MFHNEKYSNLSIEAKLTYGILLSRMELSLQNEWINDDNEIYLIYTREELMRELKIGKNKTIQLFKELNNHALIFEEKRGLGRPNYIYVGKIEQEEKENQRFKNQTLRSLENKPLEVLKTNPIYKDSKYKDNILTHENKKINHLSNVNLTKLEYDSLVKEYGKELTEKSIIELSLYKKQTGKEYKSDYAAIKRWCIDRVKEKEQKNLRQVTNINGKLRYKNYEQREYDDLESFYDNIR